MLNFCILNSNYLLRTFELKFLLFQKNAPNDACAIKITKLTSQAMWQGQTVSWLGWSWTKEIYGNHWEIDETKFSSVKVSHKYINNYIFQVKN